MPLRVFIVEDNADTLKSLTAYLERRGHRVRHAGCMEDALTCLPQAPCDLLLSDIGLPDGDGWELLHRLPPHTPPCAVAMSGYGTAADVNRSREAGFHCHLIKPLTKEALEGVLAQAERAHEAGGDCMARTVDFPVKAR